ncbi:flavodoxin [Campylobacter armoricus]|uniref:Flavodoxin (Flavodoxin_4 domain) n=1 Tax=Campylobacter armoricus TaxID=2505970 RepID=A0A7L5HQ85_9BACT|nr:flavodoxin [Campylobacter armoricus]QKF79384.1 flavodoxin (Flavodoxin_4 domain) [Campylobacter armoricus]
MNSRRDFLKKAFLLSSLVYCAQFGFARTEGKKSAIVYYSRTLNTHILAKYLQNITKSDLISLQTINSYPSDFDTMSKIAKDERNRNFKPKLVNINFEPNNYDMIFIGTPVWAGGISSPLRTFLSMYNFDSKIIIPFCTQVKDGIEGCVKDIQGLIPNSKILEGIDIKAAFEKEDQNLKSKNEKYINNNTNYLTSADKQKIDLWLKKYKN